MCTHNYKTDCILEKRSININGLRAEIIVDNEINCVLNSLQKFNLRALKTEPVEDMSELFKCTVDYQPGNIHETCIFSFLFKFNHSRNKIKKILLQAGGFITQEGQIPEIISFKGKMGIDVYFVLDESNLIIDTQYLPLEKRLYNGEYPRLSYLKELIRSTDLNYLLEEYIPNFQFEY
ncbi:hypothetical protein ACNFU2_06505 [Chryseobacterium sp. PTM-20240506]|uniref:hypothetical protein n=1 Tax=Chryseobacterium sp. PTM-20240506 TaxID=3400631 RepID=UPI003AAE9DBA